MIIITIGQLKGTKQKHFVVIRTRRINANPVTIIFNDTLIRVKLTRIQPSCLIQYLLGVAHRAVYANLKTFHHMCQCVWMLDILDNPHCLFGKISFCFGNSLYVYTVDVIQKSSDSPHISSLIHRLTSYPLFLQAFPHSFPIRGFYQPVFP